MAEKTILEMRQRVRAEVAQELIDIYVDVYNLFENTTREELEVMLKIKSRISIVGDRRKFLLTRIKSIYEKILERETMLPVDSLPIGRLTKRMAEEMIK